jgi:flagellar FliL protein
LILAPESHSKPHSEEKTEVPGHLEEIAFVSVDPLTISMPRGSNYKHLRFRAELEVDQKYATEVEAVLPRIVDVLNSYLRALEVSDIEEASALTRLRSQMLRRVQIVAGPGRINDLLIMEFVLN